MEEKKDNININKNKNKKDNKNPSKLILLIHKAYLKYPEYFNNKKIFLLPSILGFILLMVKFFLNIMKNKENKEKNNHVK
jgi:hypothetical protein